jgi:hypothetical protein
MPALFFFATVHEERLYPAVICGGERWRALQAKARRWEESGAGGSRSSRSCASEGASESPGSANEQATKHASLLSFSLHLVCVLLRCGVAIYAEGTKS